MPANILYTADDRPVFASNETTWWGYEPEVTGRPLTFNEAWEQSGIGRYRIVEQPMNAEVGLITTHKALVRHDDLGEEPDVLLNVVTKERKTFQPYEALSLAPAIMEVSEDEPVIQTLGALDNGKIWYATVMFPQEWRINGDVYKGYIFITDRVNGSCTAAPTPIRVLCGNTYGAAMSGLKGVARYVVRHTSNATLVADDARRAIGMLPEYMTQFQATLEELHSQDFTFDKFLEATKTIFGEPDPNAKTTRSKTIHENRTMELARLWKSDTQESTYRFGSPTKATAYHAFGEYVDWTYGSKDGRMKRAITADSGRLKAQFSDLLLAA
jgi:phage/plasmid-like protein (TIGR03299 family)